MKNNQALFDDSAYTDNLLLEYINIRDEKDYRLIPIRKDCENMWDVYSKYADDNFLSDFKMQFYPRWFEMYLTFSLLEAGVYITKTGDGMPDVLAKIGERKVWIEAVCVGPGEPGKPDSVPDMELLKVSSTPERELTLRTLNALHSKDKQFKKYIEHGIVEPDDLIIVAISYCNMGFERHWMAKYIRSAVYGEGDPILKLGLDNNSQITRSKLEFEQKAVVTKRPGSTYEKEIGVQSFIDFSVECMCISAILGSCAYPKDLGAKERGNDFIMFPNLTSDRPLAGVSLPVGMKYVFTEQDDGWSGKLCQAGG